MLVDLDLYRLAWVLEHVAEESPDTDDDGNPNVVSAARALIEELKEELDEEQLAELEADLAKGRPLRGPGNFWRVPVAA